MKKISHVFLRLLSLSKYSVFLFIFSLSLQSCITSRPHAKTIVAVDTIRGYQQVNKPYYKKQVSGFGGFVNVLFIGGGAVGGYLLGNNGKAAAPDEKNTDPLDINSGIQSRIATQGIYTGLGAAVGHSFYRLLLGFVGNHKIRKCVAVVDETHRKNRPYSQWVTDYDLHNAKDWFYIADPKSQTDRTFWVLPRKMETTFKPLNFSDVKNFHAAFPQSPYLTSVIVEANHNVETNELLKMIKLFPQNSATFDTKLEYVNRTTDEADFLAAISKFPETEKKVELKYAAVTKTFATAKNFIAIYPTSSGATEVFNRVFPELNHQQLGELIDLYPNVSAISIGLARKMYFEQCTTFKEILAAVQKYNDATFAVKPTDNLDTKETAEDVYNRLKKYQPGEHNTIDSLIFDLKKQFITQQFDGSTGNTENILLLSELIDHAWLKDERLQNLHDKIKSEAAHAGNEEIFEGKKYPQYTGDGVLYKTNGEIVKGNFVEGKLNGLGKKYFADGASEDGEYKDGQLNGNGKKRFKNGTLIEGVFEADNLHGAGKITRTDSSWESGDYISNHIEGKGERHFKNGDSYVGFFENGRLAGKGKYTYSGGKKSFQGIFFNDAREGHGLFTLANGCTIEGDWKADCPDGEIKITKLLDDVNPLDAYKATWIVKDCKVVEKKDEDGMMISFTEEEVLQKMPEH